MAVPLKIDITTGDKITPREMMYSFNLMFEERSINVLAYTVETILAEKLETIISRGDQNTRPRDFYAYSDCWNRHNFYCVATCFITKMRGQKITLDMQNNVWYTNNINYLRLFF